MIDGGLINRDDIEAMKKRGNNENKGGKGRQNETKDSEKKNDKKNDKNSEKKNVSLDEYNEGFSEWLRSSDGFDTMRLFVVANSIMIFVTMGIPKIQEIISIIKDYYYET
ncbi:E3 ubiquitin-protein ligase protein [Apis mellifera caucasica]|uniref:E3 ubiquitin-protein ligase protein PFF1365c n=1 Tax=Apis mellifera TaxID=7460 RepID=A0A7M7G0U4_APIME|nr:putative E3 ubiquitin-protein ligase protein PFF1365c [Apis mellifera]KAG6799078.1 E3 ubiquitin-protein ligase protein [Apis mellifera caucasica]|eukprot:XP_001119946.2 putative E3 ubiquitin-protein ligase protein PFF1365c [Apis mellifera]